MRQDWQLLVRERERERERERVFACVPGGGDGQLRDGL